MCNVDSVIVEKLVVKFEGNEILGVDDFDLFACSGLLRYGDFLKGTKTNNATV